ncbi:MAG: nucleoside triphosphate pyrophosphohydrolase [Oscillospiraceae bacterium]|nr:nucleoside triphosphate pyrophosphohydrolase [Oscillospiraceae bacterium]
MKSELVDFEFKDRYDMDDLLYIMKILRSEKGCPWDKVQTHKSIRMDMIEEAYEACEAIDNDDSLHLREELGDVLLQVVFHSTIEEEQGNFTFADAVNDLCQKLVGRHPHVFGDVKADTVGEALSNWNDIKQADHGQETYTDTLNGVSKAFPALMRAQKVGKRSARAGLDFRSAEDALASLESEIAEVRSADKEHEAEELGDMLFAAVNTVRLKGYNAEELLTRATEKFIGRFAAVEDMVRCEGLDMRSLDIDTLDTYWEKAKTTYGGNLT